MAITLSRPVDTSPEPKRFRTWLRRIMTGGQIVESCPSYCTDHHRGDDRGALEDLQHGTTLPGVEVDVDDAKGGTAPLLILAPRIAVEPYSTDPTLQTPHIILDVAQDEPTLPLAPDEFMVVIAKLRGHLDALEADVLSQLRAAIDEHEARQ